MDKIEFDLYLLRADLALSKKEGTEFQDFFVDIATAMWDIDFEDRRPQGRLGDKKCDGYRVTTKTVFQCYGPRTMEAKKLEEKIDEDFNGAITHFGKNMLGWSLVHNDSAGLPTTSHEYLIKLRDEFPNLKIENIGPRQMIKMIMSLDRLKLQMLFPGVPSAQELRRINFAEIDELMKVIDGIDPDPNLEVPVAPSAEKASHNQFPDYIVSILRTEEIVASRFHSYFSDTSRAEVGNRVSERFKRDYQRRKAEGQEPSQIFFGLTEVGGGLDCEKLRAATLLGLLGYLFFSCEIFEDRPKAA